MNTTLLQQMGLGGLDLGYLVIAVGVAIVLLLVVLILLIGIERGQSVEQVIIL